MDILIYNELETAKISGFGKLVDYLKEDDFKSAEVKKIQPNLYRAKLNRSDRILFSIYQYQEALLHKDLKCKAPLIEPNLRRNLGKWST